MSLWQKTKLLEESVEIYKEIFQNLELDPMSEQIFVKYKSKLQKVGLNRVLRNCPFPHSCNYFEVCNDEKCNATLCDNGFPKRMG